MHKKTRPNEAGFFIYIIFDEFYHFSVYFINFLLLKIDIILVVILEYKKNIVNQHKPIVSYRIASHRNNTNVFKIRKKRNLENIAFWCGR